MSVPSSRDAQSRESLWGTSFDVLVIGGGIVGAGAARDAASRGLRTLLVEQSDFASGTSSRSSRLLHGGLRYLAQGKIKLVREASVEKMRLCRIAPHLCQPLPFLFPVRRGMGWSLWQLSIGVRLYDLLCGGRNLGKSTSLRAAEILKRLPGLRGDQLLGATRHYDALTNDARLVIDTLRTAEESGATLRNYTSYLSATSSSSGWQCQLRDELSAEPFDVEARVVINAAGAWASRFPQSGIKLRLTKGVHLVIPRDRLPVDEAVVLTEGKRILFVIPWGERVILGTTDTDYAGDPANVCSAPEDVHYILDVVNDAFPEAGLECRDVLATWSGVRPLIAPREAKAGAPSDISRRHVIRMSEPGWIDVAGGKLTTYRQMAQEAVDQSGRFLGVRLPKSRTAVQPLSPGRYSGVLPPPLEPAVVAESCQREWAVHLDDVLLRRTSWHYYHSDQEEIAEMVAEWMAEHRAWDAAEKEDELSRYLGAAESTALRHAASREAREHPDPTRERGSKSGIDSTRQP